MYSLALHGQQKLKEVCEGVDKWRLLLKLNKTLHVSFDSNERQNILVFQLAYPHLDQQLLRKIQIGGHGAVLENKAAGNDSGDSCSYCGSWTTKLKACARCGVAKYCGKDC